MLSFIVPILFSFLINNADCYVDYGQVTSCNFGITEMQTQDGNRWELVEKSLQIGKQHMIIFDSHGTRERQDDEIIFIAE